MRYIVVNLKIVATRMYVYFFLFKNNEKNIYKMYASISIESFIKGFQID